MSDTTDTPTILGDLRARRAQIVAKDYRDLPVKRWSDPVIFVRYKVLPHQVIRRAITAVEKAPSGKVAEIELDANTDLLIKACVGVFARIDGQVYSLRQGDPKGDPTLFDDDLADALGMGDAPGERSARSVVRYLFMADGDILSHARSIGEFSGYQETTAEDEFSGE